METFKLIIENLVSREFELDFRILYKRRGCGYDRGSMRKEINYQCFSWVQILEWVDQCCLLIFYFPLQDSYSDEFEVHFCEPECIQCYGDPTNYYIPILLWCMFRPWALGFQGYDTTASLDTNGWLFYRLIMQGNIRREAKEKY